MKYLFLSLLLMVSCSAPQSITGFPYRVTGHVDFPLGTCVTISPRPVNQQNFSTKIVTSPDESEVIGKIIGVVDHSDDALSYLVELEKPLQNSPAYLLEPVFVIVVPGNRFSSIVECKPFAYMWY